MAKKSKPKPVLVKAQSFEDMLKNHMKEQLKAIKEFEKNGGMCLECGKYPGDPDGSDPMYCKKCNAETEELLSQLRSPGFMEIKF